ncbi:IS1-like element transposase [Endozoicomonas montiporae]
MAINSSGVRDTSRVLGVSKTTVIKTLKSKEPPSGSGQPKHQNHEPGW